MNVLRLILHALGTCVLIVLGTVAANWVAWLIIVAVTLPVAFVWRRCKRRNNARSS